MAEATLLCPHCRKEIKLTESLAAPLIEQARQKFTAEAAEREAGVAEREAAVALAKVKLAEDRASIDEKVAERLRTERSGIAKDEAKKARELLRLDFEKQQQEATDLKAVIADREKKLVEAQKAQAELEKKKRELDDAKREMDLTVQKKITAGLAAEREKARVEADERAKLTIAERDQMIAGMKQRIDELQRKAEQGSQQTQGDVQEVDLHAMLVEKFPDDDIDRVAKGQHGGDILHRVAGAAGKVAGTILWESKRTKNFSPGWLGKLRDDQRAAKAEVAVLVTQAMPDGVDTFEQIDGIWVTHTRLAVPIAMALRQSLIELAGARLAAKGQQSKAVLVYEYLTGPHFRQRIEAIIEAFDDMQADLDRERKAIVKSWAKRAAQHERILQATTGMFGDLQGIAGRSLKEIRGLDVKLLAAAGGDESEE